MAETAELTKDFEGFVFKVIVVVAIVLGFVFFVFMAAIAEKDNYSAIYLKPGSYFNTLKGKDITFAFGVQNQQRYDANFTVEILIDEKPLKKVSAYILRGQKQEFLESIRIDPERQRFPVKIKLVLLEKDKPTKSFVFFWLRKSTLQSP